MLDSDDEDAITIFNLYISDKIVENEMKKRKRDYILPIMLYAIEKTYQTSIHLCLVYYTNL